MEQAIRSCVPFLYRRTLVIMNSGSSQLLRTLFVFAQTLKTLSPQIPTEVQFTGAIKKTNSSQSEATGTTSCECRARLRQALPLHSALPKPGDLQHTHRHRLQTGFQKAVMVFQGAVPNTIPPQHFKLLPQTLKWPSYYKVWGQRRKN